MMKRLLCLCVSLSLLSSCGYHRGTGQLVNQGKRIDVPYIEGDFDGQMTAELISVVSRSGSVFYSQDDADLTLKVKVIDYNDENIGYQFDEDVNGNQTKRTVPNEGRTAILAEATLVSNQSGQVVWGPTKFTASVDFDFDPDITRENITSFSRGQFNSHDAARDVALRPLSKQLAQKIVNHLAHTW